MEIVNLEEIVKIKIENGCLLAEIGVDTAEIVSFSFASSHPHGGEHPLPSVCEDQCGIQSSAVRDVAVRSLPKS